MLRDHLNEATEWLMYRRPDVQCIWVNSRNELLHASLQWIYPYIVNLLPDTLLTEYIK